ncbi:MAG: PilZ domain-containing protein [Pseudomonadales bacterium]|nr:PilZ domain-containing protein [Pseudomonadales bacterium]
MPPEPMEQEEQQETYTRADNPKIIAQCLDSLMSASGAALVLTAAGSIAQPVVVKEVRAGQWLLVDISSVGTVAARLQEGAEFCLLGQSGGKLLRSCPLVVQECRDSEEGLECYCAYPAAFDILQRRSAFRAELRQDLRCRVIVHGHVDFGSWAGALKNLSLSGCLLDLPLPAATMLALMEGGVRLELAFPNGAGFDIDAVLRHEKVDMEQRLVRTGFEFARPNAEQERSLWFFVREIEREAARSAASDNSLLVPSTLFQPAGKGTRETETADAATLSAEMYQGLPDYPIPMARALAGIAEFLDAQILALRKDEAIDAAQLSRHSERLLALLDEDREALLFAARCLWQEPPVVSHCLTVAMVMVDLAGGGNMSMEVRKAMMASAMVHDLGKAMLPSQVLRATELSSSQQKTVQTHVLLLASRLQDCGWLSPRIRRLVAEQANERLDGSGYPEGLKNEELHDLTRLMSVVDTIDAMGRSRPDRPAQPIDAIYRHLLQHPERFDVRWVKRYIKHFGILPVGTLVRYEVGQLAWIRGLNEAGRPSRVQLTRALTPPRAALLGEVLSGEELQTLGKITEILVPDAVLPGAIDE